jgi:hypothetical protein
MLALAEFREVLGGHRRSKSEPLRQSSLPFPGDDVLLRPIVLLFCSEFLLMGGLRLACGKWF